MWHLGLCESPDCGFDDPPSLPSYAYKDDDRASGPESNSLSFPAFAPFQIKPLVEFTADILHQVAFRRARRRCEDVQGSG